MLNTVSESSITNDGIVALKFASARAREIFSLEQILKKKTRRSCSTKDLSVLWEKITILYLGICGGELQAINEENLLRDILVKRKAHTLRAIQQMLVPLND